jgi:hypothetical protein
MPHSEVEVGRGWSELDDNELMKRVRDNEAGLPKPRDQGALRARSQAAREARCHFLSLVPLPKAQW